MISVLGSGRFTGFVFYAMKAVTAILALTTKLKKINQFKIHNELTTA
ncbi:hypothetical protein N481_10930 [Pseudoalteromonas luteoviolacea S4047-1]|uniref:Uncharacterized protein n=1 Tax=Pseudoalteromonas luteoviolacea S4054 TaxID=1129367 RepID=A0A0F6AC22_9GAMM|nr:hypothetical protein N479_12325 [Pseudoalteromonas luteoviolacea S4054]KZN73945.1 hypothetical protein N481_10930 [Pseudoalteromonas luteoviolacea S4047-1]